MNTCVDCGQESPPNHIWDQCPKCLELEDKRAKPDLAARGQCPNDTDGDGDCHKCHRRGACFYIKRPRPGAIVFYTFTLADAQWITRQRRARARDTPLDVEGPAVEEGTTHPAIVVRSDHPGRLPLASLHVFLDGPDTYWADSREHDARHAIGTWSYHPADEGSSPDPVRP